MKTIAQWQAEIADAANRKFPGNVNWSQSDRLASIQRQLDDVIAAEKVERGVLQSDEHGHQNPDHRIAALIADILILADMRGSDVEAELEKVLQWFNGPKD